MNRLITGTIIYEKSTEPNCMQDIIIKANCTSEAKKLFKIVIDSIFKNSAPTCEKLDLYYNKKQPNSTILKFFISNSLCIKINGIFTIGGVDESSNSLLECIRELKLNSFKIPDQLIVGNPNDIIHIIKTF